MSNWAGSIFDTAGTQAERIARLAWVIIVIAAIVYVIVLVATGVAMHRARARRLGGELADTRPETEHRIARVVGVAAAVSAALLLYFVTATARTGRAIAWPTDAQQPLTIEVTGHQWWWQFRYRDSIPSNWLTTSNELHIPIGRPVRVILLSNDVIHSFWIPELHGKQDIVPGHRNTTWLRAERPGRWKARCAEFCGYEHAKMAFDVVAEPPAQFNQWYLTQLASATPPSDSSAVRGYDVFVRRTCVMCHTINGTPAGSGVGPDLTHLASRPSIAAGTLPNNRGNLAGWILDPQAIKPGVQMPPTPLSGAELNSLLDYLETLK